MTKGILTLHSAGKENILYQLANVIAEKRMDMERMPLGLIDYTIHFFQCRECCQDKDGRALCTLARNHVCPFWSQVGVLESLANVAI